MEKVVIVGGGIAGLSCLNALLDNGISPLLLEAAKIGTPKMCGEFLAPTAVDYLQQWQMGPIQPIKQAIFSSRYKHYQLNFNPTAGAFARSDAELQLAQRARANAGRIIENSPLKKIIPATENSPFRFILDSGEEVQAETAIFATGRLTQSQQQVLPYVGFKIHFEHIVKPETLFMVSLPGAYLGIVPVSDKMSNSACLMKREVIEQAGSCQNFLKHG